MYVESTVSPRYNIFVTSHLATKKVYAPKMMQEHYVA